MAGVSTREIKNRIRSMESTRQITKAMEMVAASKLRHTQARIAASRPYFESIYRVIRDIAATNPDVQLPYMSPAAGAERVAYIVIAGDRGLAGGYNSNVLKACLAEMNGRDCAVLPIGRKAADFFHAHGARVITDDYAEAEAMTVGECFTAAKALCAAFLRGEYSEVRIAYTTFVSVLSQRPDTLRLLPLEHLPAGEKAPAVMLYDPSEEEVFQAVVPEYLGGVLFGALCESRASEQAARRSAMDTATQNAEDMIAELSLKYNQARQTAITQEITEIVAGS